MEMYKSLQKSNISSYGTVTGEMQQFIWELTVILKYATRCEIHQIKNSTQKTVTWVLFMESWGLADEFYKISTGSIDNDKRGITSS
jgi:hypothetical protein